MSKGIIDFINSIDNSLYNRIRQSKSDAECRRYLREHLEDINTVLQSEQLKCECKKPTFTRTVDEDFNLMCGKCGRTL